MRKFFMGLLGVIVLTLASTAPALAAGAEAASEGGINSLVVAAIFLGAGLSIGLGAIGPGMGMGSAVRGACEGMARNPGMYGKLITIMFLGLAIMEALTIYAFVITLMLLFYFLPHFLPAFFA